MLEFDSFYIGDTFTYHKRGNIVDVHLLFCICILSPYHTIYSWWYRAFASNGGGCGFKWLPVYVVELLYHWSVNTDVDSILKWQGSSFLLKKNLFSPVSLGSSSTNKNWLPRNSEMVQVLASIKTISYGFDHWSGRTRAEMKIVSQSRATFLCELLPCRLACWKECWLCEKCLYSYEIMYKSRMSH